MQALNERPEPELLTTCERLPAKFQLYAYASPSNGKQKKPDWAPCGEIWLDWKVVASYFTDIAKAVRDHLVQAGAEKAAATRTASYLAAIALNNILSRTRWRMTELFDLWLCEVLFEAGAAVLRLQGAKDRSKEALIDLLIKGYAQSVRETLNKGKRGTYSGLLQFWAEVRQAIHNWPHDEPPKQTEFALTLPTIKNDPQITPDLKGEEKRLVHKRVYDRFRDRLRSCREANLCPNKPWEELWREVRKQ